MIIILVNTDDDIHDFQNAIAEKLGRQVLLPESSNEFLRDGSIYAVNDVHQTFMNDFKAGAIKARNGAIAIRTSFTAKKGTMLLERDSKLSTCGTKEFIRWMDTIGEARGFGAVRGLN